MRRQMGTLTCIALAAGAAACSRFGFEAVGAAAGEAGPHVEGAADASGDLESSIVGCVAQLRAGSRLSCALKHDSSVWCWGQPEWIGPGSNGGDGSLPVRVTTLPPVKAIAVGNAHACAVDANGSAWCWGYNAEGQLGNGTTQNRAAPLRVAGPSELVGIAAGNDSTCAWNDTTLWCWGDNGGHLGDGTNQPRPTPVVAAFTDSVAVSMGRYHTCAQRSSGGLWCWGRNDFGMLGDGSTTNRLEPTQVPLARVVDFDLGMSHTCALLDDRSMWCWGQNGSGQLGDGSTIDRAVPTRVNGIAATSIGAGEHHTCAVSRETVTCWGSNDDGQLGSGTAAGRLTPGLISALAQPLAVAASDSSTPAFPDHSCANTTTGVWCWGSNEHGQLGDGTFDDHPDPVRTALSCD